MVRKVKKKKSSLKFSHLVILFLAVIGIPVTIYLYSKPTSLFNYAATVPSGFVYRNGKDLYLNNQQYRFTGVNAYELATLWSNNSGCGAQVDNIDGFFQAFRPNSVIRFWAWQGALAVNWKTKQIDWAGIDRVIQSAEKNNQKLVVSLGSQDGSCDDGRWKDKSWYDSGYQTLINDGTYAIQMPYFDYVKAIVTRYKDSSAIAMWEPMNEPEVSECSGYKGSACMGHQTCPDNTTAANSMRTFFDTVGSAIKSIDPNHLIETGVIGNGQCGAAGDRYQYVHESPYVDVASFHDYSGATTMPGDQWNGLQTRINQMNSIQKPLIIGEDGIAANDVSNCTSLATRRDQMKAKMDAMFSAGIAGFLPWNWIPTANTSCAYETITNSDPLFTLINSYNLGTAIPTTAPIASTPLPTAIPTVSVQTATIAPTSSLDTIAPTVTITNPINNTSVRTGRNVTISATATDNIKVTKVDLLVNNVLKKSDISSPYSYTWKVPSKRNVTYVITAKASDAAGNISSASVTVTSQ